MNALLPLGITALVLGVLLGALVDFPSPPGQATQVAVTTLDSETFSFEQVEEVGAQLSSVYTSIIADLVSFREDPDYARAQVQREVMVVYAGDLAPRLQALADRLKSLFVQILAENPDLAAEYDALMTELETLESTAG